jgi:glucan phosphorylase
VQISQNVLKILSALFRDYFKSCRASAKTYRINICHSGRFSSDRIIAECAGEIWKIESLQMLGRGRVV